MKLSIPAPRSAPSSGHALAPGILGAALFLAVLTMGAAPGAADFAVGDPVQVEWNGIWYDAHVVAVDPKHLDDEGKSAPWLIHYDGYGESSDEWVGPARIRREAPAKSWVDGPYLCPPPGSDWHAFVVTKAGKELFSVDSAGVVRSGGKKLASFDRTWGYLYKDGKELGWIDTRGQIRVGGKVVASWDWGGAGLFLGRSEEPILVNSYGILYKGDEPWGTVMGVDETALGEDGAFALLMVCLVPEFAP